MISSARGQNEAVLAAWDCLLPVPAVSMALCKMLLRNKTGVSISSYSDKDHSASLRSRDGVEIAQAAAVAIRGQNIGF